MPSSLIIVALVVAWLLVLVPIVARKRQEVARTADSTLAARVVHSGGVHSTVQEDFTMPDADTAQSECLGTDDFEDEFDEDSLDDLEELPPLEEPAELTAEDDSAADLGDAADFDAETDVDQGEYADEEYVEAEYDRHGGGPARPYRPGRGGFDPEAAAAAARAKYAFRQRVVLFMLFVAVATGVAAALVMPLLWWLHGAVDLGLIGYLSYLRRQVRIEEEIRQRRTARLGPPATQSAPVVATPDADEQEPEAEQTTYTRPVARTPVRPPAPGTVVVDMDDEDPVFDHLAEPDDTPYRRAVGE